MIDCQGHQQSSTYLPALLRQPPCSLVPPPGIGYFTLYTQAFVGDGIVGLDARDEDDQDSDVTVTAVAAAAFAGGWFCALLAMITMACWSELSVVAQGGTDGERREGPWRTSFSAWLVGVFIEP